MIITLQTFNDVIAPGSLYVGFVVIVGGGGVFSGVASSFDVRRKQKRACLYWGHIYGAQRKFVRSSDDFDTFL